MKNTTVIITSTFTPRFPAQVTQSPVLLGCDPARHTAQRGPSRLAAQRDSRPPRQKRSTRQR
jgi:hypothetical protein